MIVSASGVLNESRERYLIKSNSKRQQASATDRAL